MSNPLSDPEQDTSVVVSSPDRNQRAGGNGKGKAATKPPSNTDELLRVLIGVMGRVAFPPQTLRQVVRGPGRAADKYVKAYNLCDGTRSMREVGRMSELDSSNMTRAISRWAGAGVVFKLGTEGRPVHLYRLADVADSETEDDAAPVSADTAPSVSANAVKKTVRAKKAQAPIDVANGEATSEKRDPELELLFDGVSAEAKP
jgi:hypothetical protein